jgi:hypothetical protein
MTSRIIAKAIIAEFTQRIRSSNNIFYNTPPPPEVIKNFINDLKNLNGGVYPIPVREYSALSPKIMTSRLFFDVYNQSFNHVCRLYLIAYSLRCGRSYHTIECPRLENRLCNKDWEFITGVFESFEFGISQFDIPTIEELNNTWLNLRGRRFIHWLSSHPKYEFPEVIGISELKQLLRQDLPLL